MRLPLLEYLESSVAVCDGAMGTELYTRGVFLNRCFDELNLSAPGQVREVHREYLEAGAEILETNTFGATRIKLEPHGLADRVRDINLAGVRIAREVAGSSAYVGGSVGPLGIRIEPYGKMGIDEASAIFAEQIEALVEGGIDLICLETFADLNELHAALIAARQVCSLPILAQVTLGDDGNSREGTPPETFGPKLREWGADIIGANCGVGPQVMLETIERLAASVPARLAAQPNAGKPRNFEGRNLYLSSPEYMASYARRFVRAGARVVGGCCGTTPAHIRAIATAVRALRGVPAKAAAAPRAEAAPAPAPPALPSRSRLADRIASGSAVLVEVVTPTGGDPSPALESVTRLAARGVDAVKVVEGPRSSAPMGALALASLVQAQTGVDSILHYTCRDRTLLQMQSELLGAHALGVRNLVLTTGEPLRIGDYIDATTVFEVDSIGLTRLVEGLNGGHDLGGKSIGGATAFYAGIMVNPAALDLDDEIRRLEYKVEAGAEFAVTAPIFRPRLLEQFLERTRHCAVPVVAAILPLESYRDAEFLANELPGMSVPDELAARMQAADSPDVARRTGIAIAVELARAVRRLVQGIELHMSPGSGDAVLEILEAIKS